MKNQTEAYSVEQQASPRPMTEVEMRVDSMGISIELLFESIARLAGKIQSSLTEAPQSEVIDKVAGIQPHRCALAEKLFSQEQSITSAAAQIQDLHDRCQL